jgi:hypothetical protein
LSRKWIIVALLVLRGYLPPQNIDNRRLKGQNILSKGVSSVQAGSHSIPPEWFSFFLTPYFKYSCWRRKTCHADVADSRMVTCFWGLTSDFAGVLAMLLRYVSENMRLSFGKEIEDFRTTRASENALHQQILRCANK